MNQSTPEVLGFSVYFLSSEQCTRTSIILIGDDVQKMLQPSENEDYLVLINRKYTFFNQVKNQIIAVPNSLLKRGANYMFNGRFVYSSDSRFAALNDGNPIKVFDYSE